MKHQLKRGDKKKFLLIRVSSCWGQGRKVAEGLTSDDGVACTLGGRGSIKLFPRLSPAWTPFLGFSFLLSHLFPPFLCTLPHCLSPWSTVYDCSSLRDEACRANC